MKPKIPSAREVRDQQLVIRFGPYAVRYQTLDQRQNDRFKWLLFGPPDADGCHEQLDEFATFREAVSGARRRERADFDSRLADVRNQRASRAGDEVAQRDELVATLAGRAALKEDK